MAFESERLSPVWRLKVRFESERLLPGAGWCGDGWPEVIAWNRLVWRLMARDCRLEQASVATDGQKLSPGAG